MLTTLLSPGFLAVALPSLSENPTVALAFQKTENPFIGILAGLIGSQCYNRFKDTALPEWLAFFSGKRSAVIMAGITSLAASALLLLLWPLLFGGLVRLGQEIAGMGAAGAGIYAFLNRLLIPFGLHHTLNNVFWFEDPRLKMAMLVALGCSMRVGEICGLTWDNIEVTEETIENDTSVLHVVQELKRCEIKCLDQLKDKSHYDVYKVFPPQKSTPSTTRLVLKAPKTESSVRDIFIPRYVAEAILEHRKKQTAWKEKILDLYTDFNLVLTQDNGYPMDPKFLMHTLKVMCEEHNLKPVVFHSLRHTSVSMKLSLCGDIKAVQGDTGHSQANMVTDVYAHINNKDRQRLAVMVNENFFHQNEPVQKPAS